MHSKLLLMSGKYLNHAKLTLKFCLILSSDTDYFISCQVSSACPNPHPGCQCYKSPCSKALFIFILSTDPQPAGPWNQKEGGGSGELETAKSDGYLAPTSCVTWSRWHCLSEHQFGLLPHLSGWRLSTTSFREGYRDHPTCIVGGVYPVSIISLSGPLS